MTIASDDFGHEFSELYQEAESENCESLLNYQIESERYEIHEVVASGGMKNIHKALDKKCERTVALATPKQDIDESFYDVFLREAKLTARLDHPNIMPIHDLGLRETGQPYFTMDLKSGDSLATIIQKLADGDTTYLQIYNTAELINIFIKICDAIAYAHEHNVIHLDIKPENIQIGHYGEVLICDWGLSKIIGEADYDSLDEALFNPDLLNNLTQHNRIKGTPGYMSPEQIDHKHPKSKQSDIYSLACLLYTLLKFKAPFSGFSLDETLKLTIEGRIPYLKKFPVALNAVINKAMARDPEDRYESVIELKNELKNYTNGYATLAENAGLIQEAKLFVKRNKASSTIILISLILVTCLTLFFIGRLQGKIDQIKSLHAVSEMNRDEAIGNAQKAREAEGLAEERLGEVQKSSEQIKKLYWQSIRNYSDRFVYQTPAISMHQAISQLNELKELYPNDAYLNIQLIYNYFICQKFNEINQLNRNPELVSDLVNLSEKYAPKLKQNGLLTPHDFAHLIREFTINERYNLAEKMLSYYHERNSHADLLPVVTAILKLWNPQWDQQGLKYDPNQHHLTLASNDIKNLSSPVHYLHSKLTILRFLKVNKLSFQEVKGPKIAQINDLKIHTLDLSSSSILPYNELGKFRHLEKLILNQKQFKLWKQMYPKSFLKITVK